MASTLQRTRTRARPGDWVRLRSITGYGDDGGNWHYGTVVSISDRNPEGLVARVEWAQTPPHEPDVSSVYLDRLEIA